MDASYYCHASTGTVVFDPGQGTSKFDPWWAILACDAGIVDYLSWLLRRHGIEVSRGSHWGTHVSFVKGEQPPNPAAWGRDCGEVPFHYGHVIHWANGRHAWVDVWCPVLTDLRAELGLPTMPQMKYHLTLGRLKVPREDVKTDHDDLSVF
jgi:hypothetical protein